MQLRAARAPAQHSFDDALEAMDRLVAAGTAGVPRPRASVLVHLNTSFYTQGEDEGLAADLGRLAGADGDVVLLQAFDERRVYEITDTLGTVVELEDAFPFASYRVVDLARLALALDHAPLPAALPEGARLAYACSYHVTLLCTVLGVPCFLRARNPYYRQKRAGLGLPGDLTLDHFLERPAAPALDGPREARSAWLEQLAEAYARAPDRREPQAPPERGAPIPWRPKPGIAEVRARFR